MADASADARAEADTDTNKGCGRTASLRNTNGQNTRASSFFAERRRGQMLSTEKQRAKVKSWHRFFTLCYTDARSRDDQRVHTSCDGGRSAVDAERQPDEPPGKLHAQVLSVPSADVAGGVVCGRDRLEDHRVRAGQAERRGRRVRGREEGGPRDVALGDAQLPPHGSGRQAHGPVSEQSARQLRVHARQLARAREQPRGAASLQGPAPVRGAERRKELLRRRRGRVLHAEGVVGRAAEGCTAVLHKASKVSTGLAQSQHKVYSVL